MARKRSSADDERPDRKKAKPNQIRQFHHSQAHPGVERRSPDRKTLVRCYVSADRIYVITITSQSGTFDQAIADRAFNSFKILD
jgi:hypothetical protein